MSNVEQREELLAKIKRLMLDYSEVCLTPEAFSEWDDEQKIIQATACSLNHILDYEPDLMLELSACCAEEVNYHQVAKAIRKA